LSRSFAALGVLERGAGVPSEGQEKARDYLEGVVDEMRMLEECRQLRGHVVAGMRETESVARLLEGATHTDPVAGIADQQHPVEGAGSLGGEQ